MRRALTGKPRLPAGRAAPSPVFAFESTRPNELPADLSLRSTMARLRSSTEMNMPLKSTWSKSRADLSLNWTDDMAAGTASACARRPPPDEHGQQATLRSRASTAAAAIDDRHALVEGRGYDFQGGGTHCLDLKLGAAQHDPLRHADQVPWATAVLDHASRPQSQRSRESGLTRHPACNCRACVRTPGLQPTRQGAVDKVVLAVQQQREDADDARGEARDSPLPASPLPRCPM